MLTLEVSPAQGPAYDTVVESDVVVVGRSSKSDLVVQDAHLSRQHARLYRDDDGWWVQDLGSRNGTIVNGKEITAPTRLSPGDVIGMSASVILVKATDASGSSDSHSVFRPAEDVLIEVKTPPPAIHGELGAAAVSYYQRLHILNEIHHALGGSVAIDELLELILDRVFELLKPQQAAVLLKGGTGELVKAGHRSVEACDVALDASATLVNEVIGKGMAALVLDTWTDERFAQADSLLESGVRSLVAAPLLGPEGALGMIVLCSHSLKRQFTNEDLELLVSLASVAAMRLRNLELAHEAAERRRLERELTLARQIQLALLPQDLPALQGYELFGGNIPSLGVSGDYYEVVERSDGRECVLMLVDVSGKGISASLLDSYIEATCSTAILDGRGPAEILTLLSQALFRRTPPERYATVFLAVLDVAAGRVTYTNGGHAPGLLLRSAGEVVRLASKAFPVGLFPEAAYVDTSIQLQSGDSLVLYTDGYTEAENHDELEFGVDRLAELCGRHAGRSPSELAATIGAELDRFVGDIPYRDDRTLLILKRL